MDLQSMDANLIKYPVQTMFESMEVTINPHFMPINLEPFAIFVIVWEILFDYQRIIFNSHENGQRIRKCQTVQNHYIPHAFK